MKTYTKEEKKVYYEELQARWREIKSALDEKKIKDIEAVIAEHGLNVSPYSYAFTAISMKHHGFDGIPYIDCKTFFGWKDRGFIVRKGEKSLISGIVWLKTKRKDSVGELLPDEDQNSFPKEYYLFHKSQVEAM